MTAIKSILFPILVIFTLSSVSTAQLVVVKKPNRPRVVVVKKAKPGKNHVWIDGHWKASGSKYVWVKGRWSKKRPGNIWIKGHWKRKRGGWIWVGGYWK